MARAAGGGTTRDTDWRQLSSWGHLRRDEQGQMRTSSVVSAYIKNIGLKLGVRAVDDILHIWHLENDLIRFDGFCTLSQGRQAARLITGVGHH